MFRMLQGAERPDVAERACPAVERVTAQTVLADIAKNDEDYNVREAAVNGEKYSGNHVTREGLRRTPHGGMLRLKGKLAGFPHDRRWNHIARPVRPQRVCVRGRRRRLCAGQMATCGGHFSDSHPCRSYYPSSRPGRGRSSRRRQLLRLESYQAVHGHLRVDERRCGVVPLGAV